MFLTLILSLIAISGSVFADVGDVVCTVTEFETSDLGTRVLVDRKLDVDRKVGSMVQMSTEIDGYTYTLSGDLVIGDFLLSRIWGKNYENGNNATGSFTSSGRLQMSEVRDNHVIKFLCNRSLASQFPRQ